MPAVRDGGFVERRTRRDPIEKPDIRMPEFICIAVTEHISKSESNIDIRMPGIGEVRFSREFELRWLSEYVQASGNW